MRTIYIFIFLIFIGYLSAAQNCTTPGQNPETAFPVCGTSVFSQGTVPICGSRTVPVPCPIGSFPDKNPFWYRFTCFSSGTLGFLITPNTLDEDYDWQLFDITGRAPSEVFTNSSLFVACNWSGEFGVTGASPAGNSLIRCDGPGVPLFSSMPTVTAGRTYLLLVSHFSDSQSGYQLSFEGGTASITDPAPPRLLSADAACDGTVMSVKLNKRMKCNTLAGNGSDFLLSPAVATVISATPLNCAGFDMDSISITLSNPIPPGNYNLIMQNGTDGNTIKDNCDVGIPVGDQVSVTVFPVFPTPMDSISPMGCSPDQIELVFRKKIRCNSIAPDGSDFIITGSYPVTISNAAGNCDASGQSDRIIVQLSAPMQTAGTFIITLRVGSDGNTLVDECGQSTPAGSFLNFSVADTVNADFTYSIRSGCVIDTVNYFHNGANGVIFWEWRFDNVRGSNLQNPEIYYSTAGSHRTQLIVSNGVCSDTSNLEFFVDNFLKAEFEFPPVVCPGDEAIFKDVSSGNVLTWNWQFGNGSTSTIQNPPPQTYPLPLVNTMIPVTLTVTNGLGCSSSMTHSLPVVNNCLIAVPSAFTPNGDGLNDYLYPLNAYKATKLEFSVYNRFGQRVFYTTNWLQKWDGKFKGNNAAVGTYVWMLKYFNTDTNQQVFQKGTSILIR